MSVVEKEAASSDLVSLLSGKTYDASNFIDHRSYFQRSVPGCTKAPDSQSRRIFQLFARYTRSAFFCTALNSDIQ